VSPGPAIVQSDPEVRLRDADAEAAFQRTGAGVIVLPCGAGAQAQFPGHRFSLVGAPDAHYDRVRFTWSLTDDGGAQVAIGSDVVAVAGDGRMRSIVGFLEATGYG